MASHNGSNRRNTRLKWTLPEDKVIAEFAGKVSGDEILIKINEINSVTRTKLSLTHRAAKLGWSLQVKE